MAAIGCFGDLVLCCFAGGGFPFLGKIAEPLIDDESVLPCRISDGFPRFPGSGRLTACSFPIRILVFPGPPAVQIGVGDELATNRT